MLTASVMGGPAMCLVTRYAEVKTVPDLPVLLGEASQ